MGPYSLLFLFSLGWCISTFIFNLFFMNLPVEGDPLEIADYFKTPVKNHLLRRHRAAPFGESAPSPSLWRTTPKGDTHPSGAHRLDTGAGGPIIAALWGLLIWKEFKAGDTRAKAFAGLMLVLFAGRIDVLFVGRGVGKVSAESYQRSAISIQESAISSQLTAVS